MTSRMMKWLAAIVVSTLTGLTSAAVPAIDIFHVVGVPGTAGYTTIQGPCYCDQTEYYSPIMLLQPGTYDFGHVRENWVLSNPTPDGGDDQPNLWLLFDPVEVSGDYPYTFAGLTPYAYPEAGECLVTDDACNAAFSTAHEDFDLIYTVSPGENAIQVGLIASYEYTSALPEPLSWVTLSLGLMSMAAIARRRAAARRGSNDQALLGRDRRAP